jgi:hypothetical protein
MLEARSLTKYYNRIAAVSGVSFTIQPRENSRFPGRQPSRQEHLRSKVLTGLIEPCEAFYQGRSGTNCFTCPHLGWQNARLYQGARFLGLIAPIPGRDLARGAVEIRGVGAVLGGAVLRLNSPEW